MDETQTMLTPFRDEAPVPNVNTKQVLHITTGHMKNKQINEPKYI